MGADVGLVRKFKAGKATVLIYSDRQKMGKAAAEAVGKKAIELIDKKDKISMVFASAPSQEEFLAELTKMDKIEWSKILAFHLDEYIGLPSDAPQAFGKFLKDRLFDKVKPGKVYYLKGNAGNLDEEAFRYSELLKKTGIDIACLGIGENGHLAFNDPHVADFNDPLTVKVVELDEVCRQQQVNDGCFANIDLVPKRALTLTMPTMFNADFISCVVPAKSKAEAVRKTVHGPISPSCPASIIRNHKDATLFLDMDSAAFLK
ncbi:MAG: glucosamine-6-phosphate deaminase [Candidatus Bathyarchaeota archaeon]|nr:glucosamine-6-phosphate deaminase [Candidatus Bathyarchaeota archaeon]